MKRLGLILLVILIAVGGTACASEKPKETPKPPETLKTEEAPKEKKSKIEKKKAETKKEAPKPEQVPDPEPEPVATVVDEASSSRQIWFEFYDPLGKSHSALIQDPGFLQRINAVLDEVPAANTQAIPYMGGGTELRVVENGESRALVFLAVEGPHSVVGRAGEWYTFSDTTLYKDLLATYHTDLYRAEPEDTYQMSLYYTYVDSYSVEGSGEPIQVISGGANAQLDNQTNQEDIQRIQQVLDGSEGYPATPERIGRDGGWYLVVSVKERGTAKSYEFYPQADGSLFFKMGRFMNRDGLDPDPKWYKVADPSLYQTLLMTYFPDEFI